MGSAQMLHTESAQLGQVVRKQWQLGSLHPRDGTLSDVSNARIFITIFT